MKTLLTFELLLAFLGSAAAAKPFKCYWEYWGV